MQSLQISGTRLCPSVLCLGTGQLGSALSEAESFALLDRFAEHGGTFLDSAHIYAAWLPNGTGASERTVGKWLRARNCRNRFVFATKGGHPELKTMNVSRLKPSDIRQDLAESLTRAQLDCVDLYWLHRDDPAIPVGEILGVLNELQREKRIRAFGCSNWTTARIEEAAAFARRSGMETFCASQISWSLLHETNPPYTAGGMLAMDQTAFDFHSRTQMAQIPYSSQARGFFAKPLAENASAINARRWHAAQSLAGRKGCSPNQIALAWLMQQPFPVFPIIGSRTREQIDDTSRALDVKLTAQEARELTD
ncbi:MAG TPA: aldo/keto reductase [Planctomycetota bacterium]|nr:aldo/keto reductase [Planctomycetota bacterium]